MPGSSSTSFIPKRNPTRKERQGPRNKIFIGSFVVRILFFATLLSAAGIYVYQTKLNSDLEAEIVSFNTAIAKFDVIKMDKVIEIDSRLSHANNRLAHTASIVSLLSRFEASISATSQVKSFSLERASDTVFEIEAQIKTGTFNSIMFQRSAFNDNDTLAVSEIADLELHNIPPRSSLYQGVEVPEDGGVSVSFTAILSVDPEKIHHLPVPFSQNSNLIQTQPVVPSVSTTTSSSSASAVSGGNSNETVI